MDDPVTLGTLVRLWIGFCGGYFIAKIIWLRWVADRNLWRRFHPPQHPPGLLTDDHGNWWERCHRDDCDLHITRPGKADCHHTDCPNQCPLMEDR